MAISAINHYPNCIPSGINNKNILSWNVTKLNEIIKRLSVSVPYY